MIHDVILTKTMTYMNLGKTERSWGDTVCALSREVQVAYWQEGGLPSRRPGFGSRPAYFSTNNPMILIIPNYS